jgi:hypothetical protein
MDTEAGRIRALDQAQAGVHGRWWVVLRPDVLLDRFAIESAVEFAGSNDIAALSLCPGMQCTSPLDRMIAPSMEYLAQVTSAARTRKKNEGLSGAMPAFLLLNRETFEAVNRMNRMPGILNEAGWNLWSYQVEGLRTFEGDGSQSMWREARVTSWTSPSDAGRKYGMREAGLVAANALLALVAVGGVGLGLMRRIDGFSGASILAFSSISYALMAISYFLYARRLRAMEWLAPAWFVPHLSATVLTLLDIRRRVRRQRVAAETHAASTVSRSTR